MRVSRFPRFPPVPNVPLTLFSGQQDALKNMQMAWYYAGYYQHQYEAQLRSGQQSG